MARREHQKTIRARLLPMTLAMLSLLFVIKLNDLYIGSSQMKELYEAQPAVAAEAAPVAPPAAAEPAAAKEPEVAAKAEPEKEAAVEKGDAHPKVEEEAKTHGTGKSTVKQIDEIKVRDSQPIFSKTEIDLLQNLSKRREELDAREKELDLKATLLEATEKRISDKIAEVKILDAQLAKVIATYNEKQSTQIKSLVKIYETMKPAEAAGIFNEMEMPILLDVIAQMSERKVAPVLANMNPKRARDVTQELAERRKKTVDAAPSNASPATGAGK